MVLPELLREIENRGVTLEPAGDRLRFRPKRNLTPELVEGLRQHKAEILERLEGGEASEVSRRHDNLRPAGDSERLENGDRSTILSTPEKRERPRDPLLNSPVIRDTGEVLELARAHFGELEHPEDPPYPPYEGTGDPMVRTDTPQARFFQGIRRRDLERREREGLPPWIRVVGGGVSERFDYAEHRTTWPA